MSWCSRSSHSMIRWTPPGGPYSRSYEATLEFPLLALAVTLVDVAAGIATTQVLVEVGV
jgi:hypothetical protein